MIDEIALPSDTSARSEYPTVTNQALTSFSDQSVGEVKELKKLPAIVD